MSYKMTDKETIAEFRRVFTTPGGRRVLRHILIELGMFTPQTADDQEATALKEFGFRLLELCGIWNEANATNVVDALLAGRDFGVYLDEKRNDEKDVSEELT